MLLALWFAYGDENRWAGITPEPIDPIPTRGGGGGLRQVILKQEEKRDKYALAIFMLDG